MKTVIMVAEKPSLAQSIANILSNIMMENMTNNALETYDILQRAGARLTP